MSPEALGSQPKIELDGAPLTAAQASLVEEVVVDDHLHLPDTFEIRVIAEASDGTTIPARIGAKVKISALPAGGMMPETLISGEVTALEADLGEHGKRLIVRGYDLSHRLARGRKTRTFQGVKYSDIATQIAGDASVQPGTIDDSGPVREFVAQTNQSDWEFLHQLAAEIDFEVAIVDDKLDFRRPEQASSAPGTGDYGSSDPSQLVFGQSLVSFHPRVSAAGQVGDFQVRGWDVQQKEAIVGSASAGTTATELQDDPASLASLFGDAQFVAVDTSPADVRAANAIASRLAEQIGSAFAEANGIARGDPHLRAGSAISVSLAGDAFDGRYTLTHTRHVFDLLNGYQTYLTVSGRQERSLLGLAGNSARGFGSGAPLAGVVVGLVDDIADPDNLGRVKIRFPWLSDDYVGDWARVVMLGAGASRGAMWLPEVGDEVLVAFEFGDLRHPIVVGGLWNGQDQPPEHQVDQGHLKVRSFVSRKGHKIRLSDDDNDAWIEVQTSNGQLTLKLDESGNEIKIAAGGAKLTVTADNDISIKANGKLSLEGTSGLDVVSSGVTKVKGQTLQLNPPG